MPIFSAFARFFGYDFITFANRFDIWYIISVDRVHTHITMEYHTTQPIRTPSRCGKQFTRATTDTSPVDLADMV